MKISFLKVVSLFLSGMVLMASVVSFTTVSPTALAQADEMPPSDVESVQATARDTSVDLQWNIATDNVGVKGYRVYYGTQPVSADFSTYEIGPVEAGNMLAYTVTNLQNGTAYYFAVTAYDAAGNESENYSVEVSATPGTGEADVTAPTVVGADAEDKNTVMVHFSEAVQLPTENPEAAFSIAEDGTNTPLGVAMAIVNFNDPSKKTVLLTTDTQKKSATYILTAGIQVKDVAGNPIESGTSDTALFAGSDAEPAAPVADPENEVAANGELEIPKSGAADTEGPTLVNVAAADSTTVVVEFSEAVLLDARPTGNFVITQEMDSTSSLVVTAARLNAEGTIVTLTTAPQESVNYFLVALNVIDAEGNKMDTENNATSFTGMGAVGGDVDADTTAPEDVTNLVASLLRDMVVQLRWSPSLNSTGDLANYVLYRSNDGVSFGEGTVITAASLSHELGGLLPGVKYFFKLTTRDTAGNESAGVVTGFMLPETGPELLLLLAGSLGAGRFMTRGKRAKRLGKK